MNQLMIHIERIVRPVNATQSRKLRMRTELLAHLQATLDEERQRFPGDWAAAIEHAKRRLGDPAELTRKLQQTVPILERALLARLPLSRRLDRLEQRMARFPGQRGPMTLGHKLILVAMAMLAAAPLLMAVFNAVKSSGMQTQHFTVFLVGSLIGWPVLFLASYHFVFAAAGQDPGLDWPATLKRGATILGLQIALTFFAASAIANRVATIGQVVACTASTVALLAISALIARRIGVLRRPYDQWLTLNIAE